MTEQDGTQGPQWPLPDDKDAPAGERQREQQEQQEPPQRPVGDRTVVFGAPHLGGQGAGGRPGAGYPGAPGQPTQPPEPPRQEQRPSPPPAPPTMIEPLPVRQPESEGPQQPPQPPYTAPQEQPQYGQPPAGGGIYDPPAGAPGASPGGYGQPPQPPYAQQPQQGYGVPPTIPGYEQQQSPGYGQPPFGQQDQFGQPQGAPEPEGRQPPQGGGEGIADRTLIVPGPGAGTPESEQQRPAVDDQATLHWSPGTDIPVATGPERKPADTPSAPSEPWQAPTPPSTPEPWQSEAQGPKQGDHGDHERTMMVPPPDSGFGAPMSSLGQETPGFGPLSSTPSQGDDNQATQSFDPSSQGAQGPVGGDAPANPDQTRMDLGHQQWGQAQQQGYGQQQSPYAQQGQQQYGMPEGQQQGYAQQPSPYGQQEQQQFGQQPQLPQQAYGQQPGQPGQPGQYGQQGQFGQQGQYGQPQYGQPAAYGGRGGASRSKGGSKNMMLAIIAIVAGLVIIAVGLIAFVF